MKKPTQIASRIIADQTIFQTKNEIQNLLLELKTKLSGSNTI